MSHSRRCSSLIDKLPTPLWIDPPAPAFLTCCLFGRPLQTKWSGTHAHTFDFTTVHSSCVPVLFRQHISQRHMHHRLATASHSFLTCCSVHPSISYFAATECSSFWYLEGISRVYIGFLPFPISGAVIHIDVMAVLVVLLIYLGEWWTLAVADSNWKL